MLSKWLASPIVAALLLVPAGRAGAATVDVDCSTQDLQAAIDAAAPGSTLLISGICYGRFGVHQSLTLEGNPTATLDGAGAGRTLIVDTLDAVHLVRLVITGGEPTGIFHERGGAAAGLLTLSHVTVQDNVDVVTDVFGALGAGILSNGPLRISDSSVVHNQVIVNNAARESQAQAGGIFSAGSLTLTRSVVSSNRVSAVSTSGSPADAEGAGIYMKGSPLVLKSSRLEGNDAVASGDDDSAAYGGAIYFLAETAGHKVSITDSVIRDNVASVLGKRTNIAGGGGLLTTADSGGTVAKVTISGSTFQGNEARGESDENVSVFGAGIATSTQSGLTLTSSKVLGSRLTASAGGRADASGTGIYNAGPATLTSSSVSSGVVDLHANGAATASGGGIDQAAAGPPITLTKSTVSGNAVTARSDTATATVEGGGIRSAGSTTLTASTLGRNSIVASTGASLLGQGLGGGLYLSGGSNTLTNSTIARNTVQGASRGTFGTGSATGGGIEAAGVPVDLVNSTVARNSVDASGHVSAVKAGGGLHVTGASATLKATIVALNSASGEPGADCSGTVTSQGHNLVGHTDGCAFTSQGSDKLGVSPKLGTFGNHGGPTKTLPLLAGSPAIDAIPIAACAVPTDQRGKTRPQGPRCDIGAFEREV